MTYNESLEYLYSTLPMYSRLGDAAFKPSLDNTINLCAALGDPQKKFKIIHIAGTNGKGSTSSMLSAVLQQAGYKSGLYTSPHIKNFGERIRINGEEADKQFIIDFVERTKELSTEIKPSFFELTFVMALDYFASQKVNVAVIECGLGGRLDSTNVVEPILSIITNISYDHVNMLGNTLTEIATEKAGIIKKYTPVIIGETLPETKLVFTRKASECNAPIYFAAEEYTIVNTETKNCLSATLMQNKTGLVHVYESDLPGSYQAKNICSVLTAVDILNEIEFKLEPTAVRFALAHVKPLTGLRGRWEKMSEKPDVIYDVAHNEDGIKQILHQLNENYAGCRKHFILGFVKEKDVKKVLGLFPADAHYYFTNAHIPRAMPKEELQQIADSQKLCGDVYESPTDALQAAKDNAGLNDVIVVCGSFFVVAELPD